MSKNNAVVWNPKSFREHYEILTNKSVILSAMERRRLEFYLSKLKFLISDNVLDVGCGYGRFSRLICNQVNHITGIDINPENIAYAKEYVGPKFDGQVVDLSHGILPFADKSFNKIVIDNVLMFFDKEIQFALLKESKRVLKEGGVLTFNIENSDYFLKHVSSFFLFLYRLKAMLQGKAFATHNKYSIDFYEKKLMEFGFTDVSVIGDTFYRKMGIGSLQIFPKMLHGYIARMDQKHYNSPKNTGMASFTVAASL